MRQRDHLLSGGAEAGGAGYGCDEGGPPRNCVLVRPFPGKQPPFELGSDEKATARVLAQLCGSTIWPRGIDRTTRDPLPAGVMHR